MFQGWICGSFTFLQISANQWLIMERLAPKSFPNGIYPSTWGPGPLTYDLENHADKIYHPAAADTAGPAGVSYM